MRYQAADLFDSGRDCGAQANRATLLASEAGWAAAEVCLDTHGGYGFVDTDDVECQFRETSVHTGPVQATCAICLTTGEEVLHDLHPDHCSAHTGRPDGHAVW